MSGTGAIIIPAHDEEHVLGRLLAALPADGATEVVVVANGCTDRTADVARGYAGVRVVDTPVPSKVQALALGDSLTSRFPRFYVDGDVVVTTEDLRALAAALDEPGVHAAGPTRELVMEGVSRTVRAYYAVWQRLPGVRAELYGRGVIAVDEEGHSRLAGWREAMSDDLVAAMSFAPHEVRVVPTARVLIQPPRRYGDLLRRRVRAMTGNHRLARDSSAPVVRGSGAGLGTLLALARAEPRLAPGVAVFLGTAAIARLRARWAISRGSTVWLRDESSRTPSPPPTLPRATSPAVHVPPEY
ncbi:glycosyltransferase family 2 protein [Georgenia wutianyii]|uniref:Glycosyltransferase family 2 protein n=1 Tax=Georgenia wutianyii TaxID=2585135 RepID=A0ABX5VTB0_9MICO|nr:glycosyltransferase family 2 protein [Georgenia wutianyii]QDB80225.1 glycosyltransferase family 2 protein [Georgenia wutianyii]